MKVVSEHYTLSCNGTAVTNQNHIQEQLQAHIQFSACLSLKNIKKKLNI